MEVEKEVNESFRLVPTSDSVAVVVGESRVKGLEEKIDITNKVGPRVGRYVVFYSVLD